MFFSPSPEKLAERGEILALTKVVCGKDTALATRAAPLLGALLLRKYRDEESYRALNLLRQHGSPQAIAALTHCLTAERSGWTKVKSEAALAMYELRQSSGLREALEAMERREFLHVALSGDLLERAVAHRDSAFVGYLLLNGSWQYPSDVRPGWDFLAAVGGLDVVARLLEVQRLWFMYEGKRCYTVSGKQGRIVCDAMRSQS